jgi:hypothetical protein
MKQLPDEKTLLELLELAKDLEQQARSLCELATKIDEKWRVRLELRRKVALQEGDRF